MLFDEQSYIDFGSRYPQRLKDEGYAPASIKSTLLSVSAFLGHVRSFDPTRSKLNGYEISALLYHLKRLPLGRIVGVQCQKIKQQLTSECFTYNSMGTVRRSNEY